MRFQTLERLPGADPEAVLQAMETGLLEVSLELVREGHRITLAGLGPSPRVKNRRDRTVIDVSQENGITTVAVDVTYQASAVLGNVPQNDVVQAKLDRVFDEMWAQLGVRRERVQTPEIRPAETNGMESAEAKPEPVAPPVETPAVAEALPPSDASSRTETLTIEPEQAEAPQASLEEQKEAVSAVAAIAASPEEAGIPAPEEPAASVEEMPSAKPDAQHTAEAEAERSGGDTEAAQAVASTLPKQTAPVEPPRFAGSLPGGASDASAEEKPKQRWGLWIAVAVLLIAAPAAWLYLPHRPFEEAAPPAPAPQSVPQSVPQAEAPAPAQSAPVPPPGSEEDPAAAVKDWEAAMQSTDAAKQAAFYADPADRYFLRSHVSRQSILDDKQASIGKRQEGWTVAMERVTVRQQAGTATARLVKHFTVRQSGRLVSQWFIPAQLLLKRTGGRWQITSERDLGWAASMEDLNQP